MLIYVIIGLFVTVWLVAEWKAAHLAWRVGLGLTTLVIIAVVLTLPAHISAYYTDLHHRRSADIMVELIQKNATKDVTTALTAFTTRSPDREFMAAAFELYQRLEEARSRLRKASE
jgi:hypothetical protein